MAFDKLFSPAKIGTMELKNRVVMSPMLMGFGRIDGCATEQLMDYYEERAKGGTGLIITEITRVNDVTGAGAFAQLGVSHDYQIAPLAEFARRIHSHGTKLVVQLHHPGRQNVGLLVGTVPLCRACGKVYKGFEKLLYKVVPAGKILLEKNIVPRSVAPSKCPPAYFAGGRVRALRHGEIKKLVKQFVDGAERCKKAGVDGVELHGTHGYLIQQFLSPYTNQRTDEYGGSLENRMRFLTEIIHGIRERLGDYPIIVRLTLDEFYSAQGEPEKGITLDMGLEIARALAKEPIDAIDVSSAGYDNFNYWLEPTSFECGWRAYLAKAVKEIVPFPVIAANLIRTPEQAEKQIEEGIQDFASLGRPLIADPYFAQKAEQGRQDEIHRCYCCLYCIESMEVNAFLGSHGGCSANPTVGKEREYNALAKSGAGKSVAVVGGGPAGLKAAELLSGLGYAVTLFEKGELGGQVRLAAAPPKKEKLNWCYEDMATVARKNGAKILENTPADVHSIEEIKPAAVFVATGSVPVVPKSIPGTDKACVCTADSVLSGETSIEGKRVVIVGSGMTGLETAEYLAGKANKLTIVEMADVPAPGVWFQLTDDVFPKLAAANVSLQTSKKLVSIGDGFVTVEDTKSKKQSNLNADVVVLSLGVRPNGALAEELKKAFPDLPVFTLGDAAKGGRIADATASAYEAVKAFHATQKQ